MLDRSKKFGTTLTVGPRLRKFVEAGLGSQLLWEENYPDQEEPTADGRGEFQKTREWIETASKENLFDLWCRGQNLIGYAYHILYTTDTFREIFR